MQMTTINLNGVLILAIAESRLDAKLAVTFRETLEKLIDEGQHAIVLDMTKIIFIDSSGLGAIVSCLKKLGPKGKLVLFGINAPVASMFKLTRMDKVFTICQNQEESLQTFEI
ncbi:STAS domain-containing protein [Methylosoma difficile]